MKRFPFVVLDIDECNNETHSCDVDAVCNNTQGSYNCTCKDGFYRDGINCTGKYRSVTPFGLTNLVHLAETIILKLNSNV